MCVCVFLTSDVHCVGFRRARAVPRGTRNVYKTARFKRERKSGARRPSGRTLLTRRCVVYRVHAEHYGVFTAKPNAKRAGGSTGSERWIVLKGRRIYNDSCLTTRLSRGQGPLRLILSVNTLTADLLNPLPICYINPGQNQRLSSWKIKIQIA